MTENTMIENTKLENQELIKSAYKAFNARDIESILKVMHPEVRWSKAWEGDYANGHEEVSAYWKRQWAEINPKVTPVGFTEEENGTLAVEVDQLVKDLDGQILFDGKVIHVYTIGDGLLCQMDIKQKPPVPFEVSDQFYHGTKAELKVGDLIEPGFTSNYGKGNQAKYVYLTATLDAATWGAELAAGQGKGKIYIVEPKGSYEDDPNVTDKKFPGNPTKSYRTKFPIRITGEVINWIGHPAEQLQTMKAHLEQLKASGIEAIED